MHIYSNRTALKTEEEVFNFLNLIVRDAALNIVKFRPTIYLLLSTYISILPHALQSATDETKPLLKEASVFVTFSR